MRLSMWNLFLTSIFLLFVPGFTYKRECGETKCYGDGAYCCGPWNDNCCWENEVTYTRWWIWLVWFWVVFMILTCIVCTCVCRRRRRLAAGPQYMVVEGQPTYGAVPVYNAGPQASDYNYPPTAVPSYMGPSAPAYQEKPPDYNTVMSGRV